MRPQDVLGHRYELAKLLGSGGFGQVWQAFDTRVKRQVAVKIGHPQSAEEARRFAMEAQLAGNLTHPNIAALYDYGETLHEGRALVYLVMELVSGETLAEVLSRGVPPLASSLSWAKDICAALGAAHVKGVVHRDIKPANVIIMDRGRGTAKVLDFGIAKHQADTGITADGQVIGSWLYMAPERWDSAAAVDGRADLYALGCVLMEMLTGQLPFTGRGAHELFAQHAAGAPPRPSSLRPGLPETADRLVMDLLAKDPVQRPASAQRVADRLADILGHARYPTFGRTTPAHDNPSPPLGHTPTLQQTEGDPVHEPDPVRVALERRLDRVLAHYANSDEAEFARMLDLLIHDLDEALGADDPLSVEAGYQRAMHSWQSAHDQGGLENMLPRLIRVLGLQHRRTIDVRAVLTGNTAARGHIDGRRYLPELREIIAQATRVLGARDPITLTARLDLAEALDREYDAYGRPLPRHGPRDDAQAARRRVLLEPLLPDLEQGLGDDSRVVEVRLRLALDTYQLGDYRAALPLYEQLLPTSPAALARSDVRLRIQHAHCVAEAGEPERALLLLETLLTTVRNRPGNEHQRQAATALALRTALKKQIRQNRRAGNRTWFHL
ncbi:serine/threonine-protein kinase [Streptomyces lancefieldiae]|uniref:Serine/threonine-protein kinase n=1 Tax=Streptomyces lancefieldiae TaxID=3075520 RepID=A0ABU3AFV6_9ACTN|nr:serine/threonine-protein kinase [Streptomyces sp. DSM 40712]MDT0609055.1 serine/threonine-protein kinase [Streptomyces sp. DSM 40712]